MLNKVPVAVIEVEGAPLTKPNRVTLGFGSTTAVHFPTSKFKYRVEYRDAIALSLDWQVRSADKYSYFEVAQAPNVSEVAGEIGTLIIVGWVTQLEGETGYVAWFNNGKAFAPPVKFDTIADAHKYVDEQYDKTVNPQPPVPPTPAPAPAPTPAPAAKGAKKPSVPPEEEL